ncbi:MAG: Uncharacterised protein [Halieaceae bacterium]|nr:MAG: Uncharacterised protein [Halieaceae bacterium]
MPCPIMPAPSMPTFSVFCGGISLGLEAPPLILFIWKKNVLIIFLAWGVSASSAKPRLSMRIAVSKSTVRAWTATSKIFSGAGNKPRVFLRIIGAPMVTICATCGLRILPPGIL